MEIVEIDLALNIATHGFVDEAIGFFDDTHSPTIESSFRERRLREATTSLVIVTIADDHRCLADDNGECLRDATPAERSTVSCEQFGHVLGIADDHQTHWAKGHL